MIRRATGAIVRHAVAAVAVLACLVGGASLGLSQARAPVTKQAPKAAPSANCTFPRVADPTLNLMGSGAALMCRMSDAPPRDASGLRALRQDVQAFALRADGARQVSPGDRIFLNALTHMLNTGLANQSQRLLGRGGASGEEHDLAAADRDLDAAYEAFARLRLTKADAILSMMSAQSALAHMMEDDTDGCVRSASRASTGFYDLLNVMGGGPGAALGADMPDTIDAIAEFSSSMLALCAVESRIDLRPVFSIVALNRARSLSERYEMGALSVANRAALAAARGRIGANYARMLRIDGAQGNDIETAYAAIQRDEAQIAAILRGREVGGEEIERALQRSGAAAALVLTSNDFGGAVIGVRVKSGGKPWAGRRAQELMTANLQALYGRSIGSGLAVIDPRAVMPPTQGREQTFAGYRSHWLGAELWPRSPYNAAFTGALNTLQTDLWRMAGADIAAVLAEMGVARGEKVILIPSGALSPLPLWLARNPQTQRALVDDYTFVLTPSLQAFVRAGDGAPAARGPEEVRGVFNPVGDLPGADAERALVEGVIGRQRLAPFSLASGSRATSWHFATHAVADVESGAGSYIVLARSGPQARLSVTDIAAMAPASKPRLVFMAACDSGLSQIGRRPDEFVGLPASFLAAGAPGVVAALWEVADVPAALLSAKFYEGWTARRLAPAEALRAAQFWLRDATREEMIAFVASHGRADDARLTPLRRTLEAFPAGQKPYAAPAFWGGYYYSGW